MADRETVVKDIQSKLSERLDAGLELPEGEYDIYVFTQGRGMNAAGHRSQTFNVTIQEKAVQP